MKRTLELGKIDYLGCGYRTCPVTVDVELNETDKGLEFTASGNIWNHIKSDIYSGGQNLDEIKKHIKNNKDFNLVYDWWKKYHLNGLNAGCRHQIAARWEDLRIDPKELPNSSANRDEKGIMAVWVYKKEHPDGLLCEPCVVCGYQYGTAWLFEEIPSIDLEAIKQFVNGKA